MGFLYQRSPRIMPELNYSERSLPAPPAKPAARSVAGSWFALPILVTLAGTGALVYMGASSRLAGGSDVVLQVLISFCMLVSYLIPVWIYVHNKKMYERTNRLRESAYLELLKQVEQELAEEGAKQRGILLQVHSDFERCESVVRRRSPSLWERSPQDNDFLSLRIGTGEASSAITLRLPDVRPQEADELLEQARVVANKAAFVPDCPIALPLLESGVIGIVAGKGSGVKALRALIIQLTARHSPDEVLLSSFFKEEEKEEWRWMRWFPHFWDEHHSFRRMACSDGDRQQLSEYLYSELTLRLNRSSGEWKPASSDRARHVVLLSDAGVLENDPLYGVLTEYAEQISLHTIILAGSVDKLPRQCRLIIECEEDQGTYTLKKKDGGLMRRAFQLDQISLEQCDHFARLMAKIKLKHSQGAALPERISLLELLGQERVEELDAVTRWNESRLPLELPVTIGIRAGEKPFVLNLHDRLDLGAHGPHGLIAGTTGSGKSALLQSLVVSIGVNYHPHDAAFLMIDYKGGGMSGAFRSLPHVVGSLTNLDGKLVERAKSALRAELVTRQKRLKQAGGLEHIDEYYRLGAPGGPLPHLFVIVDEFAELKSDYPDFIEELISIAAIGRTLGLHLILATQKPAGVVDDKIWSNARFRICLRVESESDSREMIKIPDAAWILAAGRGFVQAGPELLEEVQFAWTGAEYNPERSSAGVEQSIFRVLLNGNREAVLQQTSAVYKKGLRNKLAPKELEVLTVYLRKAAEEQGIAKLNGPWLPPLSESLSLSELPKAEVGDQLTAYVGLADDIQGQRQFAVPVRLKDGHFALYGMPGSGKTTFLQTFLMSLAGGPGLSWHGYIIDMGRMMQGFAELPQVGAVITADESDRIGRLFRFLKKATAERRELLAAAGIKNAEDYRNPFGRKLPDIIVLIDDYHAFRNRYPYESEQLDELLREGGAAGIRFLITAGRYGDIPEKTRSSISQTAALELGDYGDYFYAVGRVSAPAGQMVRGRGYMKGHPPVEFQTALPVGGSSEYERAERLRAEIAGMDRNRKGDKPARIQAMPAKVNLRELLPVGRLQVQKAAAVPVPVGIAVEDLGPIQVRLDSGPHFIVGAPMGGGKTSFLESWILSLAWHIPPARLGVYMIEARAPQSGASSLTQLSSLPHVRGLGTGESGAAEIISLLDEDIREAGAGSDQMTRLLAIDDADLLSKRLTDFAVKDKLTELVRRSRECGLHIVLSGIPADFPGFGSDWFAEVKACQAGFVLGTKDPSDLAAFRIPLKESASEPGELPVLPTGEGFYVNRRYERMKAAVPFDTVWTPDVWIARVCDQWEVSV
ncbi:type VII secretion protein EssC [Paenibacillus caui]|uniref:type VII secretion protein EssC n=1 Tax=Paenibacillus caui TaxID=2873927 RepID=UPI001CA96FA2|nr:type VII secretion protein EssC [Paenibacillus caui]